MQQILKPAVFVMLIFLTPQVEGGVTSEVHAILMQKCLVKCHSGDSPKGDFAISDMKSLVEDGWVTPNDLQSSSLWLAVTRIDDPMPIGGNRLSADELKSIMAWILSGAPAEEYRPPPVRPWSYWFEKARSHLDSVSEEVAKDTRFLVLPETFGKRQVDQLPELVHFVLSYLARKSNDRVPQAVEGEPRMVAVRLSWYGLESLDWKIFEFVSEFTPVESGWKTVGHKTDTGSPVLFLTEFVNKAFFHPVYTLVKRQPLTWSEFLQDLNADPDISQQRGEVASWLTLMSGVSGFPRILDRYISLDQLLVIWQSYDFLRATEEANPVANPATSRSFQDGGEMVIFRKDRLPEFYLTDGEGNLIPRGPISVVSDPRQPDLHVALGKSCAMCHASGTVPTEDHLRSTVERFSWAYSWYEQDLVLRQNRPKDEAAKIVQGDAHAFVELMSKLNVNPSAAELVQRLVVEQAQLATMERLSRILGVQSSAIESVLSSDRQLARNLGTLVTGPGIDWAVVEDQYPRLAWKLGIEIPEKRNPMMERGLELQERRERRIALSNEAVGLLDEQIGRSFQWASLLDPDDSEAFAAANKNQPVALEAQARRVLRLRPFDTKTRSFLAVALQQQGRTKEAARQWALIRRLNKRERQVQ